MARHWWQVTSSFDSLGREYWEVSQLCQIQKRSSLHPADIHRCEREAGLLTKGLTTIMPSTS